MLSLGEIRVIRGSDNTDLAGGSFGGRGSRVDVKIELFRSFHRFKHGVVCLTVTQKYVKIISERYGKTYHPVLEPVEAAEEFNLHVDSTTATTE